MREAETMMRRRVRIERIADATHRELVFNKRKNGIMRRAMELSVLCDCDVAVIVYDSRGRLYQFSSGSMDTILSRYSRTCTEPHESHSTKDLYKHYLLSKLEWEPEGMPPRKRQRSLPYILAAAAAVAARDAGEQGEEEQEEELEEGSEGAAAAAQAVEEGEEGEPCLSPRSAQAYGRIVREFDRLIKQVEVEMETAEAVEAKPSPQQQQQQDQEEAQARRESDPTTAAAAVAAPEPAGPQAQEEALGAHVQAPAQGAAPAQAACGDEAMPDAAQAAPAAGAGTPVKPAGPSPAGTPAGAPGTTLPGCPGAPRPIPLLGLPPQALPVAHSGPVPLPLPASATQLPPQLLQQQHLLAGPRLASPPQVPATAAATTSMLQAMPSLQTAASPLTATSLLSVGSTGAQVPTPASGQTASQSATYFAMPMSSAGMGVVGSSRPPQLPYPQTGQQQQQFQHPQQQQLLQQGAAFGARSTGLPTPAVGITMPSAGAGGGGSSVGLLPAQLVQQMQQAMQAQGYTTGNFFLRPMLTSGGGSHPTMATLIPASAGPGAGGAPGSQRVLLHLHPAGATGAGAVPTRPMVSLGAGGYPAATAGGASSALPPASLAMVQGAVAQPGAPGGQAMQRPQQHHVLIPTAGGQQGMVCGVVPHMGGMAAGGRGLVGLVAQPHIGAAPGMVPASQLGGGSAVSMQQPAGPAAYGGAGAAAWLHNGRHPYQHPYQQMLHLSVPGASAAPPPPPAASAPYRSGMLPAATAPAPPAVSAAAVPSMGFPSFPPHLSFPTGPASTQQMPTGQALPPQALAHALPHPVPQAIPRAALPQALPGHSLLAQPSSHHQPPPQQQGHQQQQGHEQHQEQQGEQQQQQEEEKAARAQADGGLADLAAGPHHTQHVPHAEDNLLSGFDLEDAVAQMLA